MAQVLDARTNLWGYRAVLAVADGMGGHEQGELAAQLAVDTAIGVLAARPEDHAQFDADFLGADAEGVARKTFALVNQRIWRRAAELGLAGNMGTTLTLLVLESEDAVVGHVGDSKAFLISGDRIEKVTEEHSWVGAMVREGAMTEEEAARSPLRGHLTQAVGSEETVDPYIHRLAVHPGDLLVVCSDGLTEVIAPDRIREVVAASDTPDEACQALIALATKGGARDNVTAAVLVVPGGEEAAVAPASAPAVTEPSPEPAAPPPTLFPEMESEATPAEASPAIAEPQPAVEPPGAVLPFDAEPETAPEPAPKPIPEPKPEPPTATPAPAGKTAAPAVALEAGMDRVRGEPVTLQRIVVLGAVCLIALLAGVFAGKQLLGPRPETTAAPPVTVAPAPKQPARPSSPAVVTPTTTGSFHMDAKVEGEALVLTSSEKVTYQVYTRDENKDILSLEGGTGAGESFTLPKKPSAALQAATVTLDVERLGGGRLRLTPTPPSLRVFVDKKPYAGAALQSVPVKGRHARIGFYFPPGANGGQYGVALSDFLTETEPPNAANAAAPPTEGQPKE